MTTEAFPARSERQHMVERAMNPAAVTIVGVSAEEGSPGRQALSNLVASGYQGEIHLVSRSGAAIEGRASLPSIAELPMGVDLAILALPASAVAEAVRQCGERQIGVATIFASGFAEVGEAGRAGQDAIARQASAHGMGLIGPNCMGYANRIGNLAVSFGAARIVGASVEGRRAGALIAQSGGMMAHLGLALGARSVPVSYSISTGNEAVLGVEDFLDYVARDPATHVVLLFVEHIRRPAEFLRAIADCRAAGKLVVMMHPGRCARAKEAARSHSGALAGDHAVMRALVTDAGAAYVDTLEELVDLAELLTRFPAPPTGGIGVMTTSGAFCGAALDFCEGLGLEVPRLAAPTLARLQAVLPQFAHADNPLDLTTQPQRDPELLSVGLDALLKEPAIGSVVVAITPGGPQQSVKYLRALMAPLADNAKPLSFAIMGDGSPLSHEFLSMMDAANVLFTRSPERAMRAMAAATQYGLALRREPEPERACRAATIPPVTKSQLMEFEAKALLRSLGIAVPAGELAQTPREAAHIAARLGYPVALKAQAPELTHKSEAGGVALGISDELALNKAWAEMLRDAQHARPGIVLAGVLVERMQSAGCEMIVGARRDLDWGPVVFFGLGGVWTEALNDIRLLPAHVSQRRILEEMQTLKGAAALSGGRGRPVADRQAAAEAVARLGEALHSRPELQEIEVNPLVVYPDGHGVAALDALVFARADATLEEALP